MALQTTMFVTLALIAGDRVCRGILHGDAIPCILPNGTPVDIEGIMGSAVAQPCIRCTCQKGFVNCSLDSCSHLKTCPIADISTGSTNESSVCCPKCRSCHYLGKTRLNDERWRSVQDVCYLMTCKAGIITTSRLQCLPVCPNGRREPGHCCPLCPTPLPTTVRKDACVQCEVVHGSWHHCYRVACPVLDCPVALQRRVRGKCCAECEHPGPRKFRQAVVQNPRVSGFCTLALRRVPVGHVFPVDACTWCKCQSGGLSCRRFTCPVRECQASARLIFRNNVCCPFCEFSKTTPSSSVLPLNSTSLAVTRAPSAEHFLKETLRPAADDKLPVRITTCVHRLPNGTMLVRKHGAVWKGSDCLNCQCRSGRVRCELERCVPSEPFSCGVGRRKIKMAGSCCAFCEQYEATCSVFGDPHYETFDGLDYSFHGNHSYVLVQECRFDDDLDADKQPAFTVVAHYAAKKGDTAFPSRVSVHLHSTPRPVVLHLTEDKVLLEQDRPVPIPSKTALYSVRANGAGHLQLRLHTLELRIAVDGRGFVGVTLPVSHKSSVCGLCGNFNDDPHDDLLPKYGDQVTENVDVFAHSWRWKVSRAGLRCKTAAQTAERALDIAECRAILDNKFFAFCRQQMHAYKYLRQCTRDVCECASTTTTTNNNTGATSNKPCFCAAIEAFAKQCANRFVWEQWMIRSILSHSGFQVHPRCDKIRPNSYGRNVLQPP